ncbi:hypothetical protein HDU92_004420 [Lobulomyces angularis]|nr:hypothetical protein HDU92_004420 [Lobulomyces angularis]
MDPCSGSNSIKNNLNRFCENNHLFISSDIKNISKRKKEDEFLLLDLFADNFRVLDIVDAILTDIPYDLRENTHCRLNENKILREGGRVSFYYLDINDFPKEFNTLKLVCKIKLIGGSKKLCRSLYSYVKLENKEIEFPNNECSLIRSEDYHDIFSDPLKYFNFENESLVSEYYSIADDEVGPGTIYAVVRDGGNLNGFNPSKIFQRDKDGKSLLHYAAGYGQSKTVQVLIEKGIDVNLEGGKGDQKGSTALMYAVRWGHLKTVKVLVNFGSDILAVDGNGRNSIQLSANFGREEILKFLISQLKLKFSNIQDSSKVKFFLQSSLENSSKFGHYDCCEVLLKLIFDSFYQNKLAVVRELNNEEFELKILRNFDIFFKCFFQASRFGHLNIVKLIYHFEGMTCFQVSSMYNRVDIVTFISTHAEQNLN